MNVKDFVQSESFYHPHADAWLVLGRDAKGRFATGWIARQNPEKIISCRRFLDEASAQAAYMEILEEDSIPDALTTAPDWKKQALYDWEDDNLSGVRRELKNAAQGRKLLRQIAEDYDIDCPRLKWGEFTDHSEYDEDDNVILFGARDNTTLLHEMAHAIHIAQLGEQQGPHHSPGFVSIAIELYHRYAGADLKMLEESAGKAGLLGDLYQEKKTAPRPAAPRAGYTARL